MKNQKFIDKTGYVFSINTGRAGSRYLSELLATGKNVWAAHEPSPRMIGKDLQLVENQDYQRSYRQRRRKVDAIKKTVKQFRCEHYVETSHMFIKTFFDVVVRELPNVKVVFLKRNLVDTLSSFYLLGYFSHRNPAWKDWMISPYATTAAIPCVIDESDDVGLSLAYLIDIYARGYRFIQENPDVPVFHISLEELNNRHTVMALFKDLNLIPTEKTLSILGQKTNSRDARKQDIARKHISKDYLRERSLSYIEKLKNNGVDVSDMLII